MNRGRYKFRGYTKGNQYEPPHWVYGSLIDERNQSFAIYSKEPGGMVVVEEVEPDSIGLEMMDGIYEGDVFVVPGEYPFFDDDGDNNYVGIVEYVKEDGYLAWYYGLKVVSDKVRGGACGDLMAELEGKNIKVIGNVFEEVLKEAEAEEN